MTDFCSLGLAEPLLEALDAAGHHVPTAIQLAAIPAVLAGRDLQGIAQTGTGKTAAFALPILHRLLAAPPGASGRTCRALVLAPTRELATQIAVAAGTYAARTPLRVAVMVGGLPKGPQARAAAGGIDILVATPGRLLDHVGDGAVHLDHTGVLVLDEADHMLDLGFAADVRRIAAMLPRIRQTLLFSATMPPAIAALARDLLHRPTLVTATPAAATAERIDQRVVFAEPQQKRPLLVALLKGGRMPRTLVFTRTKDAADGLVAALDRAGIHAAAIHGDKSQPARDRTLAAFRAGRLPVLVATDVAARGIDIDGLSHVVNYDMPEVAEAYVHRVGRTARAGARGVAISLCAGAERPHLRAIEKLVGTRLKVYDGNDAVRRR